MQIIIVGCGKVGSALAAELSGDENNITVIDIDPERVKVVTSRYDVMGVTGNGATHDVQLRAGIEGADLLIAVTGADELNLLCCLIAKKASGCRTIARIKDPQYSADAPYLKNELGLSLVINPEYTAAEEIARVLRFPSAIKIETFAGGRVELMKLRLPENSPLAGLAVKEATSKIGSDVLICTVERGSDAFIVKGDFVFKEGDVISIVATPKSATDFFRKIKYKLTPVKDAIIVGGGELSHYLCSILRKSGIRLSVIEKELAVCEKMCVDFPDVSVINADPTDKKVLLEEGVGSCGALISLGKRDEENVFLSLFAKQCGRAKLITKVDYIDYDEVLSKLDLDTIINPKALTAESIVRFVRAAVNDKGSNVEALYGIAKGRLVAMEFLAGNGSPVLGRSLSELRIKDDVLVAAIIRNERVIIPRGYDVIEALDRVVIVSGETALTDISDILR